MYVISSIKLESSFSETCVCKYFSDKINGVRTPRQRFDSAKVVKIKLTPKNPECHTPIEGTGGVYIRQTQSARPSLRLLLIVVVPE